MNTNKLMVLLATAIVLAVSNPTEEQYSAWLQSKLARSSQTQLEAIGLALAGKMMALGSERTNLVFFSYYITGLQDDRLLALGVLGNFFAIGDWPTDAPPASPAAPQTSSPEIKNETMTIQQSDGFKVVRDFRHQTSIEVPANYKQDVGGMESWIYRPAFSPDVIQIKVTGFNPSLISAKQEMERVLQGFLPENKVIHKEATDRFYELIYHKKDTVHIRKVIIGKRHSVALYITYPMAKKEQYEAIAARAAATFDYIDP